MLTYSVICHKHEGNMNAFSRMIQYLFHNDRT